MRPHLLFQVHASALSRSGSASFSFVETVPGVEVSSLYQAYPKRERAPYFLLNSVLYFSVSGVCFILLRQRILVCLHYHFFHATSRLQGTQPSRRNESEFISHELEGIDQLAPQKRSSIARTTRSSRRQSCTRDITSFSAASRLSVDSSICSYQRNGSLVFSCIGTTSLSSFSSRSSCVVPSSLTWLRISNQTISYPLGAGSHYRTTS